jgi:hypothetical protein
MFVEIPLVQRYPRLGLKFLPHDSRKMQRRLMLAKYLPRDLAPPPAAVNWTGKVKKWPMYLNDQLGDCAIAGPYHQIECWTANVHGTPLIADDQYVCNDYAAVSGFNGDPNTDNGCNLIDVQNYWRQTGLYGGTDKILGYAAVEPANTVHLKQGVQIFGSLNTGIVCTDQMMEVNSAGRVWDIGNSGDPQNGGGHCVPIVAYDASTITVVTWGGLQKATWAWWQAFGREAYAIIAKDWVSSGMAPCGFDLATLQADLAEVTGE